VETPMRAGEKEMPQVMLCFLNNRPGNALARQTKHHSKNHDPIPTHANKGCMESRLSKVPFPFPFLCLPRWCQRKMSRKLGLSSTPSCNKSTPPTLSMECSRSDLQKFSYSSQLGSVRGGLMGNCNFHSCQ
jgi:hypothetical protein